MDAFLLVRLFKKTPNWKRQSLTLTHRPFYWYDIRAVLVLVFTPYFVAAAIHATMAALHIELANNERFWLIVQSIALQWLGIVIIAALLKRRRLHMYNAFGIAPRKIIKHVLLGVLFYLAIMPILLVCQFTWQVFLHIIDHQPDLQDVAHFVLGETNMPMRIYLVIMGVALAPIMEEIFFRGILLPICTRRGGIAKGIILVSLIFATIHFHVPSLVPLFILSVAFSLAYFYSKSIIVPITMHSIFNGTSMILLMITGQQ